MKKLVNYVRKFAFFFSFIVNQQSILCAEFVENDQKIVVPAALRIGERVSS